MKKDSLDIIVTRKLKELNFNAQTIDFFLELLSDFKRVDYIEMKPKKIANKYGISHRTLNRYIKKLRDEHFISDHKVHEPSKNGEHTIVVCRRLRLARRGLDLLEGYNDEKSTRRKVMSIE